MRQTILIVDDLEVNRIILKEILQKDYEVLEAKSGHECLDLLTGMDESQFPQAVLMDILMPGIDGFEVLKLMKSDLRMSKIPVLIVTNVNAAENESMGLNMGAMDYISRPFNPDVVKARVDNCIQLNQHRSNLERLVDEKTKQVTKTHERIMEVMASIIEHRADESNAHIQRTGALCTALVANLLSKEKYRRELLDQDYMSMIKAMSLHDIGKIAIPDMILLKPGRLTKNEFEIVKSHTTIGHRIIQNVCNNLENITPYLRHCMDICRHHHERWDGTGYPDGLSGASIPLSARILSVVDVFDALSSERCYKPAFPYEEAIRLIQEGQGTQFDPDMVDAMMEIKEQFITIHSDMADKNAEWDENLMLDAVGML